MSTRREEESYLVWDQAIAVVVWYFLLVFRKYFLHSRLSHALKISFEREERYSPAELLPRISKRYLSYRKASLSEWYKDIIYYYNNLYYFGYLS